MKYSSFRKVFAKFLLVRENDPNAEGSKTPETAAGSSAQETIIHR